MHDFSAPEAVLQLRSRSRAFLNAERVGKVIRARRHFQLILFSAHFLAVTVHDPVDAIPNISPDVFHAA